MIKFEHTEVLGWEHAIRGMRNPMNSWEKSDSKYCAAEYCSSCDKRDGLTCPFVDMGDGFHIGQNDHDLMMRLRNAGTDHRKFMRMITVYVDITAPLYWWKEFDTYKVGTVANSCSTMHKIADKEFTLEDFSCEHLDDGYMAANKVPFTSVDILKVVIESLNYWREKYLETMSKPMKNEKARQALMKQYWWQMIQLLPSSYNQKRTVMLNYEVLANIYKSRKNHKLDEWSGKDCFKDLARNCNTCVKKETSECHGGKEGGFIQWIESLPYSEIITGPDISQINIPEEIMKEAERRIINRWVDAWNDIRLNSSEKDLSDFLNKKLNINEDHN